MAGYEWMGTPPFRNVYLHGIVRDKLGRKMSKSLGNSPDPLVLIEQFGADGVRMGMLLSAPAGNDILFDEALCEQGRNFNNKIWNAFRLVRGWSVDETLPQPESAKVAIAWFDAVLQKNIGDLNDQFDKYRLSEALMNVYKLFWDEFSSWYLELVKPAYQQPIDGATYRSTLGFFDTLLRLLHPFMPFITEELWQLLNQPREGESLMVETWPDAKPFDAGLLGRFELVKSIIGSVRTIRQEKNIANKEPLPLLAGGEIPFAEVLVKMCNLSELKQVSEKPEGALSFICDTTEFYIPLAGKIDMAGEMARISSELAYLEGFLASVMTKLNNQRFVQNAPQAVLQNEQKKQADTQKKIEALTGQLAGLGAAEKDVD